MRVRKVDSNWDFRFGHGLEDYWINQPEGVGQAVESRLRLALGDWFLNTADGTPWATKVLGKRTENTRNPVIKARILGTPGVKGIVSYAAQLQRDPRAWAAQVRLDTVYGLVALQMGPQ